MHGGKVLVTGAGGQVGRALMAARWPAELQPEGLDRAALDLTDLAALRRALQGAVAVVNAAAYTAVDRAEQEPALAWRVNAGAVAGLARLTAEAGIPLLHLSTDYVFDGRKPAPYEEEDPVGPLGAYGASKAAGEQAVRLVAPRHLILRTSWVYDRGGRNFVSTMLRLAGEREELGVVADQQGAPTAAGDIAAAVVRMLEVLRGGAGPWGTYHFTGAGETTWHGFAAAILASLPNPPRLKAISSAEWPAAARRPANSRLSCRRIDEAFGIRPRPWREMLAEVLDAGRGAAPCG